MFSNQHLPTTHYNTTHTLILYSKWIMVVVSGLSFRRRIQVSTGNDQRCFLQVAQVEAGHEQKESRSLLEIDLSKYQSIACFPCCASEHLVCLYTYHPSATLILRFIMPGSGHIYIFSVCFTIPSSFRYCFWLCGVCAEE